MVHAFKGWNKSTSVIFLDGSCYPVSQMDVSVRGVTDVMFPINYGLNVTLSRHNVAANHTDSDTSSFSLTEGASFISSCK